jgi:subtilisin family serine protease
MDEIRRAVLTDGISFDGSGVRIAVIDTGVDPEHPDLTHCVNLEQSESFCLTSSILDRNGHGTHIAGIISGSGEASDGRYKGIAPGAELIIFKVLEGSSGYAHNVLPAVERAIALEVDIINYSGGRDGYGSIGEPPWKWPKKPNFLDKAFLAAVDSGILCVAAAGNEGPTEGTVIRPGNLEPILQVGATSLPSGNVSESSARGPVYIDDQIRAPDRASPLTETPEKLIKPDVVAPGGDGLPLERDFLARWAGLETEGATSARSRHGKLLPIPPDDPNGLYARMPGTSQATAVVTGLAALLLQLGRELVVDWGPNQGEALRQIIRLSALRLKTGGPEDFGYGAVLFPQLQAIVTDFARDPAFRTTVLRGRQFRLI